MVRARSLPYDVLIWFILQKSKVSNQRCLDDFFDGQGLKPVTGAAFTQARANLCYTVFKKLNRIIVDNFFASNNKVRRWKGFLVRAVDGSTLLLPGQHASLSKKFSYHRFGPKADAGHWMSRISYLYDVFNGLVLDAQMESYSTSETSLCKAHIPFMEKDSLVLFDAYYGSYELMFDLFTRKVGFVFHMKHNWLCVKQFLKSTSNDTLITLHLPNRLKHLLEENPQMPASIQVRLLKKKLRNGEVQVFCCSLTDEKTYSRSAIINLYKERWGVEEAYKLLKCRLEVADFSGRTAWAIQQDFYAKTLLLSLSNAICFNLKPKAPKKQRLKRNKQKRIPIINRTDALHAVKKTITMIAFDLDEELLSRWMNTFIRRLQSRPQFSRKNQYYERKPKPKPMPYSNYKFA